MTAADIDRVAEVVIQVADAARATRREPAA
jgi:hypothetical protein